MYRHIFIPTDGSSQSERTVAQGLALAGQLGARVTVFTVLEPFRMFSLDPQQVADTRNLYERHARQWAAKHLQAAEEKARPLGVDCRTVMVEHDRPYEAIIDHATRGGCDLIVMASHGRQGVKALLLGSETVKVLTHSSIPVLVYRDS